MFGIPFRMEVNPAKRQIFVEFIEWNVRVAGEWEPGILLFDLYQDPKDEIVFFGYEAYHDYEAFDDHKKKEYWGTWLTLCTYLCYTAGKFFE